MCVPNDIVTADSILFRACGHLGEGEREKTEMHFSAGPKYSRGPLRFVCVCNYIMSSARERIHFCTSADEQNFQCRTSASSPSLWALALDLCAWLGWHYVAPN